MRITLTSPQMGEQLAVSVEYKGLKNGPVLVTSEGRFESAPKPTAQGPDLGQAAGLYEASWQSGMRLRIRENEQRQVLAEVERRVDSLALAIANLNVPKTDLPGVEKTAVSSDPQALSADADSQASSPALYSLGVRWPAQGRSYLSSPQNPVEVIPIDPGTYTLDMTVDGQTYSIEVDAHPGTSPDTQEEFLDRLARVIDAKDSRISADLVYGFQDAYDPTPRTRPMDRVVQLRVYSNEEGQGPDFYFSDSGDSTLVSDYGLDKAAPRRPARVELNAALRDQQYNTISLDDGHVSGEIYGSTVGGAEIAVSQGTGVIEAEMKNLLSQYNGLVGFLDENADLLRPSLKDRIIRPLEERFNTLQEAGLNPMASGRMSAGDNLRANLEGNFAELREALFSPDGWASALATKLGQIQNMDINAFAASLTGRSQFQERSQAMALMETLGRSIINGYI